MPRKKGVPYARSDQLKERRTFTLTPKALQGLMRLVMRWGFKSASGFLESLGRGEIFLSRNPQTMREAMTTWDIQDLAEQTTISPERLEELRDGVSLPTLEEITKLARTMGVKPDALKHLIKEQEHQTNGH